MLMGREKSVCVCRGKGGGGRSKQHLTIPSSILLLESERHRQIWKSAVEALTHNFPSSSLQESLCYCCVRLKGYFKALLPVGLRRRAAKKKEKKSVQCLAIISLIHQILTGATCLFYSIIFFS